MTNRIIESIEQTSLKNQSLQFDIGDTVDVSTRIIEGEKERIQVFSGTVIARRGRGINETFIVRRIVNNEGVERVFPLHSPFIAGITVKRGGEARRAKLYYLRNRVGKAVRLTEKRKEKREDAQGAQPEASDAKPARKKAELAASAS